MGARPSSFKKGGGFLNGVDGTWVDYQFTDEFNGEPFRPGKDPKTKKEKFHALYAVITVQVDGADEPVTTTLFVGGADDFTVSEDGHTIWDAQYETEEDAIAAGDEARQLGAGTSWAKLINSLVEAGFPETALPEESINFEAVLGGRYRWVQKRNEEDTKRLGKRKAKNGKEYDRQDLLIETVYDLPGQEAAPAAKAAAKSTAKAPAAKGGKTTAKAAPKESDLETLTETTLLDILKSAKDNTIAKNKLSMQVLQKLMKDARREDVRKLIFTDDFLGRENGWSYDQAKGTVTLNEE